MQPTTVALCMIVRDEAENLPVCLNSVRGLADEIWVVDTGSTDGTPELAQALGANVLHFTWIDDFSAARNQGLELAQAEWILVLDADEQLVEEDKQIILDALAREGTESVAAFILPICSLLGDGAEGKEMNYNVRLFRNRRSHRYEGAIHEQIAPSICRNSPEMKLVTLSARVLHCGYLAETIETKQKPARNLAIVERQLEKNPDDYYLQYHAAVCRYNLGQFEQSVAGLKLILQNATLDQSYVARSLKILVVTLRRLGRTEEALAALDKYQHNWPRFTDLEYLRAQLNNDRGDLCRALDAALACRILGEAPPPYDTHEGVGSYAASRLVGELAEKLGNKALAEQAYGETLSQVPVSCMNAARWLKLLAARVGLGPAVMELARRIPNSDHILMADICAAAGFFEPAMQFIGRADGSEAAKREFFRGRCLFLLGRTEEAFRSFRQIEQGQPEWGKAGLWRAYCALALESSAILDPLEQTWGQIHTENQRLLNLIRYLTGGEPPIENTADLILPLLKSVAPCLSPAILTRGLELIEQSDQYDQWLQLASSLFSDYGQPELAWRAYERREPGFDEPWLVAALHRHQGHPYQALRAYLSILPDEKVQPDDYLQAALLCKEVASCRPQGGEVDVS